jgi:hypothetical protein
MKKNPKDGGYYQRSVKPLKDACNKLARKAEKSFGLPSGSVHIAVNKLGEKTKKRLMAA